MYMYMYIVYNILFIPPSSLCVCSYIYIMSMSYIYNVDIYNIYNIYNIYII